MKIQTDKDVAAFVLYAKDYAHLPLGDILRMWLWTTEIETKEYYEKVEEREKE